MKKSQNILVIGCGAIGNELAKQWADNPKWTLFGMRRATEKLAANIKPLAADYTQLESMRKALNDLRPDYVVLTLTPSSYSEQAYQDSYIAGVKNTLAMLADSNPRRIIFVSSTSVYGQSDGELVDENSKASAKSFSGAAMRQCETLLDESLYPSTSLRCGGIYSRSTRRFLNKVQAGEFSYSEAFTNRIHIEDCAAAIAHIIERDAAQQGVEDIYLCVDSEPCRRIEVERWLAQTLNVEFSRPKENNQANEGNAAIGKRSGNNKRCSNRRLLNSGYVFKYPSYREGYTDVLQGLKT